MQMMLIIIISVSQSLYTYIYICRGSKHVPRLGENESQPNNCVFSRLEEHCLRYAWKYLRRAY